jgi:hypothetical protein
LWRQYQVLLECKWLLWSIKMSLLQLPQESLGGSLLALLQLHPGQEGRLFEGCLSHVVAGVFE